MIKMIQTISSFTLIAVGLFSASPAICQLKLDAPIHFETLYENSAIWPLYVSPKSDLYNNSGDKILSKGIRSTFVRAYEDGFIAVADRSGTHVVPAIATDLLDGNSNRDPRGNDIGLFLSQIGRRTFNLAYSKTSAVPESELIGYNYFLLIDFPKRKYQARRLLKQLNTLAPTLSEKKICIVLIPNKISPNKEFIDMMTDLKIHHPTIIPVFNKGFRNSVYSERETGVKFLLIDKNNKIISKSQKLDKVSLDLS